jgi:hypothetical protein
MSMPRCPNDPCKAKELVLYRETHESFVFRCTFCNLISVRSKEHITEEARWVKKMRSDWEQEQLQRQKDSKPLIFT